MPGFTKDEWYEKFYNPDNAKLLAYIRDIKFGELKATVHEGRPTVIYIGKRINIRKSNDKPQRNN